MQGREELAMLTFDFHLLGSVIRYSIGSFLLGVALTLFFVFLLFYIIRGFYPKRTFSPLSIATGVVLTLCLMPQMVQLCGAVALKSMTSDVAVWLDDNVVHSNYYNVPVDISPEQSTYIVAHLVEQFPMVDSFIGGGVFEGFDTSNICTAIAGEMNQFLNQFIWKSIGWSTLFLIIGAFIVVYTVHRQRNNTASSLQQRSWRGLTNKTTIRQSSIGHSHVSNKKNIRF